MPFLLRKTVFPRLAALVAVLLLLPACVSLREAEPHAPMPEAEGSSPGEERREITADALLAANRTESLIERYGSVSQTETWALFTRTTQRITVNGFYVLYTEENHDDGEKPYSVWEMHLEVDNTDISVSDTAADAPDGFIDYDLQNGMEMILTQNAWEDSSPFLRMILSDPGTYRIEAEDDVVVCRFEGKDGLYAPGRFLADPESLILNALLWEDENGKPVEEGKTVFTYGDPPLAESLFSSLEHTRRVVYHIEREGETSDLALAWPAGWYLTVNFKMGCQLFRDKARTEPIRSIMAVPADGNDHEIWVTDNPS